MLVGQLTRRFGPPSFELWRNGENGTESEIVRWADQVHDAKTLENVFR